MRRNDDLNVPMSIHILDIIKKVGGVTTTSELASHLNVSWNTAEKKLLELTIEGKLTRIKKAGVNLWVLKKE
jgi:Mn-dependent DtxR family transcriptional regulator